MTDAQWKVLNAMKDRGASAINHHGRLVWAATIRIDEETAQEISLATAREQILAAGYLDD